MNNFPQHQNGFVHHSQKEDADLEKNEELLRVFDQRKADVSVVEEERGYEAHFEEVQREIDPHFRLRSVDAARKRKREPAETQRFKGEDRPQHRTVRERSQQTVHHSEAKVLRAELSGQRSHAADGISAVVREVSVQLRVESVRNEEKAEADDGEREAEDDGLHFDELRRGVEGEGIPPFGRLVEGELLHVAVEQQQKEQSPKLKLANPPRQCAVEEQSEGPLNEHAADNHNRQTDNEEVLAVSPQSLFAHVRVVCVSVVEVAVRSFVVGAVPKAALIDGEEVQNSLIVDKAPLFALDFVDAPKHCVHRVSVDAVVELEEVNIVENSEVVKNGG